MTLRKVIGVMSGTSCDALDAALVHVEGTGLDADFRFIAGESLSLGSVGQSLWRFSHGGAMTALEIAEVTHAYSELHIQVIERLINVHGPVDLICIHGQTVAHRPPISWQLLQPAPIAQRFRTPVVYDLRQADLALGGQGAPLSPLADAILLRGETRPWAVVNLGGFVNVTLGPDLRALDVCPCNLWLDSIARDRLGANFDADGQTALRGQVISPLREQLGQRITSFGVRSLGSGDETFPTLSEASTEDVLRTAVEAIASAVRSAVGQAEVVYLAGGGRKNLALRKALSALPCQDFDVLGVTADYREAAAWAILGALSQDRIPIAIPSVTGAGEAVVAGSWILP